MWPQLLPKVMCGSVCWMDGWPVDLLLGWALLIPRLAFPRYTQAWPLTKSQIHRYWRTHTHTHTHTQLDWLERKATQYPLCCSLGPIFCLCLNPNPGQSCVLRKLRSSCLAGGREQIEGLWNDSVADREWVSRANSSQRCYSHRFLPLWSTTHLYIIILFLAVVLSL